MVSPTPEDFEPRRDGWFEHRGIWDEVTLGTVIASHRRSERWEIVEQAMGTPVSYGHTLWMRAREQSTGAEFTVDPRNKTSPVTILTQSPADTTTAPPTDPSDAEAIMLLVRELGATHLATRDERTGEITCPDYASGHYHEGSESGGMRAEMEHLRFAHGIDTSSYEAMPFDERIIAVSNIHGLGHDQHHQAEVNHGGFPHRHVPEDLTIFTGKRN